MKEKLLKVITICLVILISGCHKWSATERVPGNCNRFRMDESIRGELVDRVSVFVTEANTDHKPNVRWLIIANKPIPLKDFEIEIGKVPDGFSQVLPERGKFIPEQRKVYYVGIGTNSVKRYRNFYQIAAPWIPNDCNQIF